MVSQTLVARVKQAWSRLIAIALGGAVGLFFGLAFLIPVGGAVEIFGLGDPASPWLWSWCGAMGGYFFGEFCARRENQKSSPPKEAEEEEEYVDPWDFAELCQKGKLTYPQLVDLCEYQMERKHANSAACLGWLYDNGDHVPMDHQKAMSCYRIAALLGHESALDRLLSLAKFYAQEEVMTVELKQERTAGILKKVSQAVEQAKAEAENTRADKQK